MNRRRAGLGLLLVPFAVAACGGSQTASSHVGTAHLDARQVVLLSAQKASSTSFTMTMSLTESITGVSGAAAPTVVTMQSVANVESRQRTSMTMNISIGSRTITELVTVYDSVVYISQDNGATWKTTTVNTSAITQAGPAQALGYLSKVGTVTDLGPTTAGGMHVEKYGATLDSTKMKSEMVSMFSSIFSGTSIGSYTSAIVSALTLKTGTVTLTVNAAGLPVSEQLDMDMLFNLSALAQALKLPADETKGLSGTMELHLGGTSSFANFGKTITVTKPADVTGALTFPSLGG